MKFAYANLFNVWCYACAVVVHLRATGDAPILKQAKFKVYFWFILFWLQIELIVIIVVLLFVPEFTIASSPCSIIYE